MQQKLVKSAGIVVFIVFTIIITGMLPGLPWWSFVIPVMVLGFVMALKKWPIPAFIVGFTGGFITWLGAGIFFDTVYAGALLEKLALLFNLPKFLLMIGAGCIAGVLSGLALHTGKSMLVKEEG